MVRSTLTALLLAAVAAGSAAAGASGFTGNVCGLLSAKQVAVISGLSSKCTNARPSKGPGSTIYVGNWAGKTSGSPQLQVTVSRYADKGLLALAKRNLNQGLPGTPKKVGGIGAGAYEARGALSASVHFVVGSFVVAVTLNTVGAAPRLGPVETLAKAVAARL